MQIKVSIKKYIFCKKSSNIKLTISAHQLETETLQTDEIDERRRRQFQQHEMKRELDRRKHIEKLTPEERAQKEREFNAQREKLKQHPKVHEPGHKKSLEDVWEEQDHLDRDTFNPKTFFQLHDTNGDERLG